MTDLAAAPDQGPALLALSETTFPSGGNADCLDDQGIPFQLWQPAPGY